MQGKGGWKRMQEGISGALACRARSVVTSNFLVQSYLVIIHLKTLATNNIMIIYIVNSTPYNDIISM